MDLQTALQQLEALQQKQYAYRTASSALYLDGVTVAPRDTAEGRGVALGILAGEEHKLFSDPQVGALLTFLEGQTTGLTPEQARQVQLLRRGYDQLSRIPAEEYMEYAQLTKQASDVWHRSKEASDVALFVFESFDILFYFNFFHDLLLLVLVRCRKQVYQFLNQNLNH